MKLKCECGNCKICKRREYMREWSSKNRERAREIARDSYARNAEIRRQRNKDYYYREPEATKKRERKNYVKNKAGGLVILTCEWCDESFEATARNAKNNRRFCSQKCKTSRKNRDTADTLLASKPERNCVHCGEAMPKKMRADARFCSERCNSSAHNLKSANGRLGPGRRREIERAYIIKRDKRKCHICEKTCGKDEIQLDHLIPVSLGGSHSPENLRVACTSCNTSKRNQARNDQLLLIG